MKLSLLLSIIVLLHPSYNKSQEKFDLNKQNHKINSVKTFSGPMGMGLIQSYNLGSNKFCVYNTLDGKKSLQFNNQSIDCPLFLKTHDK